MTLTEIGIIIGIKLSTTKHNNGGYTVSFPGVEVSENALSSCLHSPYGVGDTLISAKKDYAERLMDAKIVIDAFNVNRRDIQLPPKVTIR